MSGRAPRVAVLWTRLTGYVSASLQALVDEGAEVTVVHRRLHAERPFDVDALTAEWPSVMWDEAPDVAAVGALLDDVQPDAILVSSWNVGGYRRLARAWRGRALRVLAMDNQWLATAKQWAGVLASPFVLRPAYDAVLVAGERQADFAARLGFPAERLVWGEYTCDVPRFGAVAEARGDALPPGAFVFVGRLVAEKAVDVLAEAYGRYRAAVTDPWPLLVAGTGPMEGVLRGRTGVELLGFVQPDDLPRVFARAGCLVLPSRFEPWGVVVHEAVAAGLPVVCTRECGASTRLVLDGYNGAVVSAGSVDGLVSGLVRMHRADPGERAAMVAASRSLAQLYSPRRWARNLLDRIPDLRAQVGLPPAPWQAEREDRASPEDQVVDRAAR